MTHTKSINFTIILFLSLLASYIASTRITFETSSDDLIRYYSAYSSIPFYTFYEYLTWDNREPLFQLYNLFTYKIFGEIPPNDYLFLMVLPGFIIYAVALKKISVNFQFSSLFFLSLFLPPILMYNTQLIRQGLSFYFLFASFLVSKKSSRNILIFISAGLHFLAVVMIIIYFILHQYITKKNFIIRTISIAGIVFILMIFPFIFKSLIPLLLQIPLIGDKFAFLTQIDISININYLGMLCMIINTGYLFFCYPTNNSSQKFYSIILLILFLSLFSIYYEALAQRFITFLYSFSIPCLMIILRKLLKRNLFIFAPLITICFFLIITATYLATPSKFALFNGYFI